MAATIDPVVPAMAKKGNKLQRRSPAQKGGPIRRSRAGLDDPLAQIWAGDGI
jgi:hypothetical protein